MANLSNINNKFLVTTGGNVLIGQTSAVGSSILQVTGTMTADTVDGTVITDGFITMGFAQLNRYGAAIELQYTPTNAATLVKIGANGSNPTIFNAYTGDATFAGNVGIGVTPYANSLSSGIDSEGGLGLFGYNDGFYVSGNAYYNGAWKYKTSGFASKINSNSSGDVVISAAANGSADGAITWADTVTIKNSGSVGIGTNSPNAYTNKKTLELDATWGGSFENSVSGTVKSRWDWSTGGFTRFGTIANEPLSLLTNSTERMRITSGGNSFFNYSNGAIETYGSGVYGGKVVIKASGAEGLSLLNNSIGGSSQVAFNFTNEFVANQYNFIARIIAEPEQSWTSDAATRDARLSFFTSQNGSAGERMRIDSSGNVGISGNGIQIDRPDVAGGKPYVFWKSGGTTQASIYGASSGGGLRIFLSGGIADFDNNIKASGVYLGGSGSANLLDDYEEGTWTPTSNLPGATVSSYGKYTKVGNIVYIAGKIEFTGKTGTAVDVVIDGLPFSGSNTSDTETRPSAFPEGDLVNMATLVNDYGHFRLNSNQMQGVIVNSSGNTIYMSSNNFSSSGQFNFSVVYTAT